MSASGSRISNFPGPLHREQPNQITAPKDPKARRAVRTLDSLGPAIRSATKFMLALIILVRFYAFRRIRLTLTYRVFLFMKNQYLTHCSLHQPSYTQYI